MLSQSKVKGSIQIFNLLFLNCRMKRTSLTAKRKRLLWTAEEEKVLKV